MPAETASDGCHENKAPAEVCEWKCVRVCVKCTLIEARLCARACSNKVGSSSMASLSGWVWSITPTGSDGTSSL